MKPEFSQPAWQPGPYPSPPPSAAQSGSSAGRLFGCAAVGCGSVLLLLIGMCGVGYWGLFYSSWPLQAFVDSMNRSGDMQVEGVRGNLSTGIEVDRIRFREPGRPEEEWSEAKGLRIRYHPLGPIWNRRGYEVEDIHLDGARLHVDFEVKTDEQDFDITDLVDRIVEEGGRHAGSGSGRGGGDFIIRQVLLQNIVFVDRQSARELSIGEIRFDGLEIARGRMVRFGDITVQSDLVDVQSGPGQRFADARINRRVEITLKQQMAPRDFRRDLPIVVELGWDDRDSRMAATAMDGQIEVAPDSSGAARVSFRNFEPADFFAESAAAIMPRSVAWSATLGKDRTWALDSGEEAGFQLGQSRFALTGKGPEKRGGRLEFACEAAVDGQTVHGQMRITGRAPLVAVALEAPAGWTIEETWARVVFGKAFEDLPEASREAVRAAVQQAARPEVERGKRGRQSGSGEKSDDQAEPDSGAGSLPDDLPDASPAAEDSEEDG